MLNVTIQNDGKIKIQSECSNTNMKDALESAGCICRITNGF